MAADGTVEMIAPGLGRKFGLGVAFDAIAKDGVALEIEPLVVVIEQNVFVAPLAVDELSHSSPPTQFDVPWYWIVHHSPFWRAEPMLHSDVISLNRGKDHGREQD